MTKRKTKPARLIVASSDADADMFYATKFWAPDPFIFLERNGKRTLVLSDLEIDRGRKQANVNEFVMFSELEREAQGKSKKAPSYEKVLAHFLKKRGVRSESSPQIFTCLRGRTYRKQNPCSRNERIFLAGARSEIAKGSGNDWPSLANYRERTQTRHRRFESVQARRWETAALERQGADLRNAPG